MSPQLSILVPFYRDDPSPLLRSLDTQDVDTGRIEIRIMDDGTGDPSLTERVAATVAQMRLPTHLHSAETNRGRSATRNALQQNARADWVLFLDADMRIDHPDFLSRYLDRIDANDCDIVFGGFDVEDHADDRDTDLHRVLSHSSDCLSAEHRARNGAQHVASSNLCVRRSVLEAQPFDPAFQGWGWEDSEWAARVSSTHRLRHIDNPAVHLGLETTETLLSRFASSGPNYRRYVQAHPTLAETLPLFKIVTRLRHVPGHALARLPLRSLVRMHALPTRLRVLALKLWRASHYAEAMK
ncbi:glycosyltransferase family 2 protein [Algimonas porphyrae]|uniref:Glycosyl transferase n=1 Tax=Algimonas porphyrae TaxID=1128113 RepID=A0ABQ5V4Y4_9PROT|nr:glycosyltransferase family 2 protein [Algimonas porphyrae]GLQ21779.1 glycosyl transferase [Algimonas porphyrae]